MPLGFLKAMTDPRFNWTYLTEPEPHLDGRRLPLPRGRVMGGSGSINGMFAMRGHPGDYDQWAQMGARGWSLRRRAALFPQARRIPGAARATYHGEGGPVRVRPIDSPHLLHEQMMATARKPPASRPARTSPARSPEGFARGEQTVDDAGRRVSAATAYLKPALGRHNLDVRSGVLVRRLVFEGKRCVGVEIDSGGGPKVVRARARGDPLGRDLQLAAPADAVGHRARRRTSRSTGSRCCTTAPAWAATCRSIRPPASNGTRRSRSPSSTSCAGTSIALNTLRWALTGTGRWRRRSIRCNVVIRTAAHLERPDMQIMVNPIRFDAQPWFPGIRAVQEHVFWAGLVQLHPESRGWVELKSADPREVAAVTLNIMAEEADRAQMRRAIRTARRIYNTEPMAELVGKRAARPAIEVDSDEELDAYHPRHLLRRPAPDQHLRDGHGRALGGRQPSCG